MGEESKCLNLGENFINRAVLAAESTLKQRPGRKLLSTIGAASKRHRIGLDRIRHNPLADYLGLENCEFETKIDNLPYMLSDVNVKYQDNDLSGKSKGKNSSLSQLHHVQGNMASDVPKLGLLASAAIARAVYKAKKLIRCRISGQI